MEIANEVVVKKGKVDIRDQIWELLKSKGFRESSHSDKILKKQITIKNPDGFPNSPATVEITVKYKFGANNLQKFIGGFKKYSIPFCRLTVENGKITKKKE